MGSADGIEVRDAPGASRYEIVAGGELAGFAEYRLGEGEIVFVHTEVDDRFEGRGLGGRLVSFALDDARRRGLAVRPRCPFVRSYIERHEEYADLLAR